jgi:hypothetical protein
MMKCDPRDKRSVGQRRIRWKDNECFLQFGVEESIVNAPPDYSSDQLFKSNQFLRVCVFNLQFKKSVFSRRVVHSQSTLQCQLRRQKRYPLQCANECTYNFQQYSQ